jgi:hypothetical protein
MNLLIFHIPQPEVSFSGLSECPDFLIRRESLFNIFAASGTAAAGRQNIPGKG